MQSIEVEIRNASGLHARPAALFVRAASATQSKVRVVNLSRGEGEADARSILAVLSLGVGKGHRIRLTAEGEDEASALEALRHLIDEGLGEAVEG